MAAYTSSQAGNWSSPSTWGGAGVPTIGDTASVGHVVTADASTTVGTSPNDVTTYVVTVTTNGQVIIPTGITLTVYGNFYCNPTSGSAAVSLQINGTGRLLFDGSPVSSTRSYNLRCVTRARVRLAGTDDANRAIIEAAAAGGFCQLQLDGNSPNLDDWNFATIIRAGDATNLATGNSIFASYNWAGTGQTISWINVTFDNCGEIMLNAVSDAASITLSNVQHYSANKSSGTQGIQIRAQAGPGVAVTVTDCIFDTSVYFNGSQFMSVHDCYFGYSLRNATGNTGFASSSNLFIVNRFVTYRTWYGSLRDAFWFHWTVDNLNYFINAFIPTSGSDELADMILDYGNTSPQQPDGLAIFNLPTSMHYSVSGLFNLPDSAGVSSGAWFNVYPDPSNAGTCSFEHNTVVSALGSAGENCLKVGERAARTGMVTSFQSNLIWTPPGKVGGQRINRHNLSSVQDIVSASNADYNWGWNLATGDGYTVGSGSAFFSTGTPDINGGSGDPEFVDPTRNLIRFDIDYLGNSPATAWADATAYAVGDVVSSSDTDYFDNETINWRCVLAHTSASANSTNGKPGDVSGFRTNWEPMSMYRLRESTARIAELQTWVKEGYAVQNASLYNAGHDGVTIGAGDFLSSFNASWAIGSNMVIGV